MNLAATISLQSGGPGSGRRPRCFACGKLLGSSPATVTCEDEQDVQVGRECLKLIKRGAEKGYQPPKGGPRLYTFEHDPKGDTMVRKGLRVL